MVTEICWFIQEKERVLRLGPGIGLVVFLGIK
jgi:hypothetical protein